MHHHFVYLLLRRTLQLPKPCAAMIAVYVSYMKGFIVNGE